MKVLLIQQDVGRRLIAYPLYPIGLSYLAAALTEHEVKIFDPNIYGYPACFDELRKEMERFRPDVVGISIRNIDTTQRRDLFVNFNTVKPTLKVVLDIKPDAKIVAGGTGFSIYAREIMGLLPVINFGVYLEGEESFPDLLSNLSTPEKVKGIFYRRDNEIIFTGPRPMPDFERLPIPRRDPGVIDITRYHGPLHNIIGVQSKRGCVFSCTYCSYLFLNEKKLRLRKPSDVVDEIETLVNNYNIKGFTFVDSIFNVPENHAREICQEIIRRKIQVTWGAWLTPKNVSEDLLLLMHEAGCKHIGYSPDAVTDKGLRTLKKGCTVEEVENSIQVSKRVKGMAVGYNFFCAYPGMSMREVVKTLITFFRIPLVMPGRGGVGLGWIRIEPHTEIFDTAIQEGLISKDAKMIPDNEEELKNLFYLPKSHWFSTFVFDSVLFLVESVMKPFMKGLFRAIGRLRGHGSLYDS